MEKEKIFFTMLMAIFSFFIMVERSNAQNPTIMVRIMETTDLHARMLGYDYETKKKTVEYGLEWTSSHIKNSRLEFPNTLLFDVGDAIVGNALAKYSFLSYLFNWMDVHPVYKVMNEMKYDAATVGNHEFNYGLDFLTASLSGADFPFVNANIYLEDGNYYAGDDINFFNPYLILNKQFVDSEGRKHTVKVGVMGLITPIAAIWDREYFNGKLKIKNMRQTAEHFVPIMKNQGADIIVVLAHAGLTADEGLKKKKWGNSVYSLSQVKGIDAILYGHSHSLFPNKSDPQTLYGMNHSKGTINEVAAVQAGYWGNHLGMIDLQLKKAGEDWVVFNCQSTVQPIFRTVKQRKIPILPKDPLVMKIIKNDHHRILNYIK
jgi:2',3'-cyclic-nucleotide 2'-phosphodiesterase / 3'-nucleotidase